MRKCILICALFVNASFMSCHKDITTDVPKPIPTNIKDFLESEGFSTYNVINIDTGYIVEGDIYLPNSYFEGNDATSKSGYTNSQTISSLNPNSGKIQVTSLTTKSNKIFKIGSNFQYRTTNLILSPISAGQGYTRIIKIKAAVDLPTAYFNAIDSAITRYNKLNLAFKFERVSEGQDINIINADLPKMIAAISSFPSNGNPYNTIKLDVKSIGASPIPGYLTTLVTHELGHAIGLRHTDNFESPNNCPYNKKVELGTDRTIQIPVPNSDPNPKSYLLACLGGTNRPFTYNDIVALNYIYGSQSSSAEGKFYRNPYTGSVYVLMEGRPRWIHSLEALVSLFGDYWFIEPYFISCPIGLPIGDNLVNGSKLVKDITNSTLYFIDNNGTKIVKRPIDPSMTNTYQLNIDNIENVATSMLNSYPTVDAMIGGANEGATIRDSSTAAIYIVINDSLRWIKDGSVYDNTFKITFTTIPNVLSLTSLGPNISLGSKLIRKEGESNLYFLDVSNDNINEDNATFRRLIPNSEIFNRYFFYFPSIETIPANEFEQYRKGDELL